MSGLSDYEKITQELLHSPLVCLTGHQKITRRMLHFHLPTGLEEDDIWELSAWVIAAHLLLPDPPEDLLQRIKPEPHRVWLGGYIKRITALNKRNQELTFQWLGWARFKQVYGVVAGDELCLGYTLRDVPKRVLIVGEVGTGALRLAKWIADTLDADEPDELDIREDPTTGLRRGDTVVWARPTVRRSPNWGRLRAMYVVIQMPTLREIIEGNYEGEQGRAAEDFTRWFLRRDLAGASPATHVLVEQSETRLRREVLQMLREGWWEYPWPGNLAELAGVLGRLTFGDDRPIVPVTTASEANLDLDAGLEALLDDLRRQCMEQAYAEEGTVAAAARKLKISRQTATNFIKRFDIERTAIRPRKRDPS